MGALIVGDDEMLNKAMVHRMAARRDASRHQWWMGFPMAFPTVSNGFQRYSDGIPMVFQWFPPFFDWVRLVRFPPLGGAFSWTTAQDNTLFCDKAYEEVGERNGQSGGEKGNRWG